MPCFLWSLLAKLTINHYYYNVAVMGFTLLTAIMRRLPAISVSEHSSSALDSALSREDSACLALIYSEWCRNEAPRCAV